MAPLLLSDGDSVGKMNKSVVFLNPSPRLVRWLLLVENAPITESTKAEETRIVRFRKFPLLLMSGLQYAHLFITVSTERLGTITASCSSAIACRSCPTATELEGTV